MPYEVSSSPVAPPAGSRLWTAGVSAGIAIFVLVGLAIFHPELAQWLLGSAFLVGLTAWLLNRKPVVPASQTAPSSDGASEASTDSAIPLLNGVFEALADPVLVISGGEADDIAGRRIVLANTAARDLLRIQREGALLVSVLRDPAVLEAVDEALFGGLARTTDYAGMGAQTRHWRAVTRPLTQTRAGPLALLVLRDDTEVRRMELMRVDFLANASHELKTPLASLSGFIETLKGPAQGRRARRATASSTSCPAQTERMGRLVSDLLSLSRIELNEHIPPSGQGRSGARRRWTSSTPSASCRQRQATSHVRRGEDRRGLTAQCPPRTGTRSFRWSRT